MEQDLYTLKEIAQLLELPESTLRKYRDAYPQFIPFVGSGRERRYRWEAADIFKVIRECRVDKHLSWEDTESELMERFPMNADALAKKVVVGEDEANIFLEKVERAVAKLSAQTGRQEFVTSALAKEIVDMKKQLALIAPLADDIKSMKKIMYNLNETAHRRMKEDRDDGLPKVLEMLATLQGAIHYIPKDIANRVSKTIPAPPPASDTASTARLKDELKLREEEAKKFRDLYTRAKSEIERLRGEMRKGTISNLYGEAKPGASKPGPARPAPAGIPAEQEKTKGAKLFFSRKKKNPTDK